jgi:hypothetical protein
MGGTGGGSSDGLAGMMKNPNMKQAMDKMGGPEGIASMMKDPAMMAMAQNMMKDPAMMQKAMAMLGGGGGMPDMSALFGGGAPSSTSGKDKKFKGFE